MLLNVFNYCQHHARDDFYHIFIHSIPPRAEVVLPTRLRTGDPTDSSSDEDDTSDSSSHHKSAESIGSPGLPSSIHGRPTPVSRVSTAFTIHHFAVTGCFDAQAMEAHLPPKGSLDSTPPPPKRPPTTGAVPSKGTAPPPGAANSLRN